MRNIADAGSLLYKLRIRMGLQFTNAIITFTNACKENLRRAGLKNTITVIPLGTLPTVPLADKTIKKIRASFGCAENDVLVVCSPRGSDETLNKAIKAAEVYVAAEKRGTKTLFIFYLRPTTFENRKFRANTPSVLVLKSPDNFFDVLESADALFAPQGKIVYTVMPPLLWLEAMMRGTPVITEYNLGIEETLEDGITGIIFDEWEHAQDALKKLHTPTLLPKMKQRVKEEALKKYNISLIAHEYAELWLSIGGIRSNDY